MQSCLTRTVRKVSEEAAVHFERVAFVSLAKNNVPPRPQ